MNESEHENETGRGDSDENAGEIPIRADALRRVIMIGAGLIALAVFFSSLVPNSVPVHLLGRTAPAVNLPLADGGTMSLGEHLGEDVILLDFWATWCAPCRVTMPLIDQIAEDYADRGVVTYFINQGESAETVRAFAHDSGLRTPIAMDLRGQLGSAFEVDGIPYTAIVDRAGKIRKVYVGVSQEFDREIVSGLESVLSAE